MPEHGLDRLTVIDLNLNQNELGYLGDSLAKAPRLKVNSLPQKGIVSRDLLPLVVVFVMKNAILVFNLIITRRLQEEKFSYIKKAIYSSF